MRVIILAAGEGTRLQPYTLDRPKCLVSLAGRPLLTQQIETLQAVGLDAVTLVAGYRAWQVAGLGYPVRRNDEYASTNMVASLMCAADLLDGTDDVLITYGDIVYQPEVVEALRACEQPISTTVDTSWRRLWDVRSEDPLTDAETLKLDRASNIVEIGRKPSSCQDIDAQYMGLIKLSAEFAPRFVAAYEALTPGSMIDGQTPAGLHMTTFLQHLIDGGTRVRGVAVDGGWLEVDSVDDLAAYDRLYRDNRLRQFYCPRAAVRR